MTVHDGRRSVLHYAYKLLSYRNRSEAEIVKRLRMKGFEESAIDRAIAELKDHGLIDDRKLAFSLRRYAEESKHLSAAGTRRFLTRRGVPVEMIDEVVRDTDDIEIAQKLLEKKISSWRKRGRGASGEGLQSDAVAIRKLYGMLYRRGYPAGTIRKVLEHYTGKEDME